MFFLCSIIYICILVEEEKSSLSGIVIRLLKRELADYLCKAFWSFVKLDRWTKKDALLNIKLSQQHLALVPG